MELKYCKFLLLMLLALSSCWGKSLRSEDGQGVDMEPKRKGGHLLGGQAQLLPRSDPNDALVPGPSAKDLGGVNGLTREREKADVHKVQTIQGGTELEPNSWPFLVHVTMVNLSSGAESPWCGGSIFDHRHIVSAAHCYMFFSEEEVSYYITAGEHRRGETEGPEQRIDVKTTFVHENFSLSSTVYDVAVLRLQQPLTFNENVSGADFNMDNDCPSDYDTCAASGWGKTSKDAPRSDVAMTVDLQVQPQHICEAVYQEYGYGDKHICASAPGKDTCLGDSGGPLVCTCSGTRVVTGIVSFGLGCRDRDYPGAYTRYSSYDAWIMEKINSPSDE